MPRPTLTALPTLLALAAPAAAGNFTPPAAIDAAVASFLGAAAGSPGGAARAVDPRMKLAACAEGLEVAWYGRNQATLQVSCPARGWRVFVPLGERSAASLGGRRSEAVVQKGETVSLVYEGSGFVLTRQGEALEPGARDQWIKIKPTGDNAKPVRGQVVDPGTVRVSAG